MCAAHLLIDKWENDSSRRDKAKRLVRFWLDDFAQFQDDGTVVWPYILVEHLRQTEDTGHATVDLDFLLLAFDRQIDGLTENHIKILANTFKKKIWRSDGTLNMYVDGSTEAGYSEHFNAGFGWFALSQFDPKIAEMARLTYQKHYRADSAGGVLWARPMLGWSNIMASFEHC